MAKELLLKYNGPPANIGRFGFVNTGDILAVNLKEYASAVESDEFEAVAGPEDVLAVTTEMTDPNHVVQPAVTESFDLTSIHWESPGLAARLTKRSKGALEKIAKAIEQSTGESLIYGKAVAKDETVSSIIRAAKNRGWA